MANPDLKLLIGLDLTESANHIIQTDLPLLKQKLDGKLKLSIALDTDVSKINVGNINRDIQSSVKPVEVEIKTKVDSSFNQSSDQLIKRIRDIEKLFAKKYELNIDLSKLNELSDGYIEKTLSKRTGKSEITNFLEEIIKLAPTAEEGLRKVQELFAEGYTAEELSKGLQGYVRELDEIRDKALGANSSLGKLSEMFDVHTSQGDEGLVKWFDDLNSRIIQYNELITQLPNGQDKFVVYGTDEYGTLNHEEVLRWVTRARESLAEIKRDAVYAKQAVEEIFDSSKTIDIAQDLDSSQVVAEIEKITSAYDEYVAKVESASSSSFVENSQVNVNAIKAEAQALEELSKIQKELDGYSVSKIQSKALFEDGKETQDRRVQIELYNKEQQESIKLVYDYIGAIDQVIQISQTQSTNFKAQATEVEKAAQSQIKAQEELHSEYQKFQNQNIKFTMGQMTTPLDKQDSEYLQLKNYFAELEKQSDSFLSKNKNGYDIWIEQEAKLSKAFSNRLKSQMEAQIEAEKANKKSESNADFVSKTNDKAKLLAAEIERIKVSWSAVGGNTHYFNELERIKSELNSINGDAVQLQNLTTQYRMLSKEIQTAGLNQKSFGDKVSETGAKLAAYLVNMMTYTMLLGNIKNAIQAVKDIDLALTEIRKVSDLSGTALLRFTDRAFEASAQLGRTGTDLLNATAEFRRAGYELESAFNLGQAALMMTNIGDGISSVEEASSALIAVLRGFKMSDSEIMNVVDSINQVSNKAAINFDDLTEGLRRFSGVAAQQGMDLAKTIALLTGGFSQLRDVEGVSAGLVTIANRLRGVTDTGEKIDGLAPKLQKAFKDIAGIDIETPNGGLRDMYAIMEDMAKILPTLTEQEQQYLNELASGSRQSKVLQAITSNWAEVENAVVNANNASGSAMEENAKYLDSIEGKTQTLSSSFQKMAASIIDSGLIKGILDISNGLVQFLSIADGIPAKFALITAGVVGLTAAFQSVTAKNIGKSFVNFFKDIGRPRIQGFKGILPHVS